MGSKGWFSSLHPIQNPICWKFEIEIDTKSVISLLANNDSSNVEPNLPMDN